MSDGSEGSGALPASVRSLAKLGCAMALGREEQLASLATECLDAGATPDAVREVVRVAIVMTECPAERYRALVEQGINSFEGQ